MKVRGRILDITSLKIAAIVALLTVTQQTADAGDRTLYMEGLYVHPMVPQAAAALKAAGLTEAHLIAIDVMLAATLGEAKTGLASRAYSVINARNQLGMLDTAHAVARDTLNAGGSARDAYIAAVRASFANDRLLGPRKDTYLTKAHRVAVDALLVWTLLEMQLRHGELTLGRIGGGRRHGMLAAAYAASLNALNLGESTDSAFKVALQAAAQLADLTLAKVEAADPAERASDRD